MKQMTSSRLYSALLIACIFEILVIKFEANSFWLTATISACIFGGLTFFVIHEFIKLDQEQREIIDFVNNSAEGALKNVLDTMPVGIIRFSRRNKELIWMNPYAEYILSNQETIFSAEEIKNFLDQDRQDNHILTVNDKIYYLYTYENEGIIYFFDVTNEERLRNKLNDSRVAIGIISVDNYDDITENMEEKETSILDSYITSEISDWLKLNSAFSRRLSSEKYIFGMQYHNLDDLMKDKFSFLTKLRESSEKNYKTITLSIGIAYGSTNLYSLGILANNNLEIALVRGGDQVVVKEDSELAQPKYFGGKSTSVVKRTRVRTRAMATALKGIIQEVDQVYVTGHRYPDMDAIGASLGVAYLAKLFKVPAYIIIDPKRLITDVERALEEIKADEKLSEIIISPEVAIRQKTGNSLLVMVDHSKPSLTISYDLYQKFEKVVVIDHHRRGTEFPASPLLSYIESGSSSACELVTELIQYQNVRGQNLSKLEATIMLAGIIVDTKSFAVSTTSRTFDVASYLRRFGADSQKVQSLLASDLEDYLKMNSIVVNSSFIRKDVVIASGEEEQFYDSVTVAKAADTLLNLSGVEASFAMSRNKEGTIMISARSKGKLNVQLVMEALGGGGHFNNAATQIVDKTIEEAKDELIRVVNEKINADLAEKQ